MNGKEEEVVEIMRERNITLLGLFETRIKGIEKE